MAAERLRVDCGRAAAAVLPAAQITPRMMAEPGLFERFTAKVQRGEPDQCWPWLGSKSSGYGKLSKNDRNYGAHRLAYEFAVGEIPDGLVIDHLCRNPGCVNPAHLEVVSVGENTARGNALAGIKARAANRTHCENGHPWTPENVGCRPSGRRYCRTCCKEQCKRWYAANKSRGS